MEEYFMNITQLINDVDITSIYQMIICGIGIAPGIYLLIVLIRINCLLSTHGRGSRFSDSITSGYYGDSAVLFPKFTTTQRDALFTPVQQYIIYNTTTGTFQFYEDKQWLELI